MEVALDLIHDSHTALDVLLTGERDEHGDVLRITLSEPYREIVLSRAELYRALSELWRQS